MNPSAILSRAADLIRDTAARAAPAPWKNSMSAVWRPDPDGNEFVADGTDPDTARWIALMSPAVAGPVEAMLRAAAHDVKVSSMVLNSRQFEAALRDRYESALALARAVLGEKEEQ